MGLHASKSVQDGLYKDQTVSALDLAYPGQLSGKSAYKRSSARHHDDIL